jgi:hypothetical protein
MTGASRQTADHPTILGDQQLGQHLGDMKKFEVLRTSIDSVERRVSDIRGGDAYSWVGNEIRR